VCIVSYFYHGYLLKYKQIWSDYDEDATRQAEVEQEEDFSARKTEYIDVIVSDVRTKNGFSFSVQILNTEGKFVKVASSLLYLTLTCRYRDRITGTADARLFCSLQKHIASARFCAQSR
jgi:hypothetical protein